MSAKICGHFGTTLRKRMPLQVWCFGYDQNIGFLFIEAHHEGETLVRQGQESSEGNEICMPRRQIKKQPPSSVYPWLVVQ